MQERPERNHELDAPSIFDALNPYFLLFFTMICVLSSGFIQQVFITLGQSRLGISIAPVIGIVLPVFLLTRPFQDDFAKQLHIHRPEPRIMAYVLVATLAMIVIIDHLYIFSQQFLPEPESYLESLRDLKPKGPVSAMVTFFGLCLIVPIAEEIVFRGLIQQVFARNMGGVVALILAGVFFGAIHWHPQLLLSMACFGIFLGFIFFATSNLSYTILSHSIVNTVAFFQLTSTEDESFQTAPFYLQEQWILVASVAVVLALSWQIKKGAPVIEDSL